MPFLLAGLFMSGLYFAGYLNWLAATTWVEVPCIVEQAELETSHDSDSTTYKVTASYRYDYQGHTYRSDKVMLGSGGDNIGDFQQQAYRELSSHAKRANDPRRRTTFRCYVNPDQPDQAVLYRDLRWEMQAFFAIFALTFPAAGAGLVCGGVIAMRRQRALKARSAAHPDEPWKWQTDWSTLTIHEHRSPWRTALHVYTIWSALIILPLLATTAMSGAFETDRSAWITLVYPALWSIPAWFSIKRLRHAVAVGASHFQAAEIPFRPGGSVRGHIITRRPPPYNRPILLEISCRRSTTTPSGDGDSTHTETIWNEQRSLATAEVGHDLSGFRIPIEFSIPSDAPESDNAGSHGSVKHEWTLTYKVPGTAIQSTFLLPVFRTADSPPHHESSSISSPTIAASTDAELPAHLLARRIRADFDDRGLPLTIDCPARRNRLVLVMLLGFNLIWTIAAVALIKSNAPMIFPLFWSVSAGIIWLVCLWYLLHQRRTTFTTYTLDIRNRLGPFVWNASIDRSIITDCLTEQGSQSNNVQFYRVRVRTHHGKTYTIVDNLTSEHSANAMAGRVRRWLEAT